MTVEVLTLGTPGQAGPSQLAETIVNGLSLGTIYALPAMGFVIIFKATQVVNFAHGAMATLGAFFTAVVAVEFNFPGRFMEGSPVLGWSVSVVVALVLSAMVGVLLERLFLRPMAGEELFAVAIITLGMHIGTQGRGGGIRSLHGITPHRGDPSRIWRRTASWPFRSLGIRAGRTRR